MNQPRAKVLDFAIELDSRGRVSAEAGPPQALPADFAPEHLALAALVRCTLASLDYHARRTGLTVVGSSAAASGRVTKRESDGRYAFVEIECRLDIELEPAAEPEVVKAVLVKAE